MWLVPCSSCASAPKSVSWDWYFRSRATLVCLAFARPRPIGSTPSHTWPESRLASPRQSFDSAGDRSHARPVAPLVSRASNGTCPIQKPAHQARNSAAVFTLGQLLADALRLGPGLRCLPAGVPAPQHDTGCLGIVRVGGFVDLPAHPCVEAVALQHRDGPVRVRGAGD